MNPSAECGVRNRTDRLRALNVQQRVEVELDADGMPVVVKREVGNGKRAESTGESWRIDDEWWRAPVHRRYVAAILDGGKRVVLFEDLVSGGRRMQKPSRMSHAESTLARPC